MCGDRTGNWPHRAHSAVQYAELMDRVDAVADVLFLVAIAHLAGVPVAILR